MYTVDNINPILMTIVIEIVERRREGGREGERREREINHKLTICGK